MRFALFQLPCYRPGFGPSRQMDVGGQIAGLDHLPGQLRLVARVELVSQPLDVGVDRHLAQSHLPGYLTMRQAFGVLKAFTLTLGEDGKWRFNIDFDATKGTADSGDPEVDIVELLGEVGKAASEHGEGVLLLLDEMQFLSKADLGLLSKAMHQISQEVLPVLIAGAGLPQLPLMLKEDKLYAERLRFFAEPATNIAEGADEIALVAHQWRH